MRELRMGRGDNMWERLRGEEMPDLTTDDAAVEGNGKEPATS